MYKDLCGIYGTMRLPIHNWLSDFGKYQGLGTSVGVGTVSPLNVYKKILFIRNAAS